MSIHDSIEEFSVQRSGGWIRLRTLLTLRWMTVVGQLIAVFVAQGTLGLRLPLELCLATISALLWFNVVATFIHPASKRLSEREATLSMVFDIVQLALLLALTGGLHNPFALLLLAPVTISASVLTLRSTVILGALALISASILAFQYAPLTLVNGQVLELPSLYIDGFWTALAVGIVFLGVYARRVTEEIHSMNLALAATHAALERERRLEAIGGLAAAAAHELGTPLATIKLASAELARELADNPEAYEDLELIRKQANRCREILADLSRGGRDDAHIKLAPISAVIDEAAEPHAASGKSVHVRINGRPIELAGDDQPTIRRDPEIVHGIRNFIQNAVSFAHSAVWVDIIHSDETLKISVGDDGPGFPLELINYLGDPYLTTRGRNARRPTNIEDRRNDGYTGMGLGMFIAKTLLKRTGAEIKFCNGIRPKRSMRRAIGARSGPDRPPGAIVEISWPLSRLVASKTESRAPLGINLPFN